MKPGTVRWLGCVCLLVVVIAGAAFAAFDDPAPRDGDEKAIRANSEKLAAALNARDAKAAAALFTSTGEFVDGDGNTFHGREAIEAEFDALFKANAHGKVGLQTDEVRLISAGVYVEEGTVTLSSATNPEMPGKKVGYLIIHAKQQDGGWRLASVRSKGEEEATPQEQLQDLAWMIGDWVDESSESVVKSHVRWSEDKNFIVSEFEVQVAGKPALKGTQRIGWDPLTRRFKSWVFDSRGGHVEGLWTQTDEGWVVKSHGVSADGEASSMTSIYRPDNADAFILTVFDRVVGDETMPAVSVRVVRKPPVPGKASK